MAGNATTCTVCELHAEAIFRVEGMDCREEVVILERRLSPLQGLEAISADLIGQRLLVKYDAARLTTDTMVDAVGQTGMRMWLEHEAPVAFGAGDGARWRLVAACGGLILAAIAADAAGASPLAPLLYVAATLCGAVQPARRALVALRSHILDINALMVVAAAGAIVLGDWLEAASVVFLFAIAQWLEVRTMERTRQAIRALVGLTPREALVFHDGHEHRVPVDQVRTGDRIVVRPGDKVPLDGIVVTGHSDVNQASITGESLPVDVQPGAEVFAGTLNGRGALEVRVTRVGPDTRLARIIHLVETAQAGRAPVQSFVDRFARVYTPVVIALAVAVALVPWLAGAAMPLVWVYRALVLLVIACPCALVISTPVSIVAALSAAARNGVLVKGGAQLERLAAVRIVAFDKTGTLTAGELRVTGVVAAEAPGAEVWAIRDILRVAASIESRSAHPIARAISACAHEQGVPLPPPASFTSAPGLGAEGEVEGRHIVVGSDRMLEARGITVPGGDEAIDRIRQSGASLAFVAVDGVAVGAVGLADTPRATAREALDLLRGQGLTRIVMLTGDRADAARGVAADLGIEEWHAGLLPEQKHDLIRALRASGPVLMVGDGVNDAPALATADVGAAMGAAGSDAALETADVALMSDELLKLPFAIRLARATIRNVHANVAISLGLKVAVLALAVTGSATLWMAVFADMGATLIVVANALRLLRAR